MANPWLLKATQSTGRNPLLLGRIGREHQLKRDKDKRMHDEMMLRLQHELAQQARDRQSRGTGLGSFIGGLAGFIPGIGPIAGPIGSSLGAMIEGEISDNRAGEGAFNNLSNLPGQLRRMKRRNPYRPPGSAQLKIPYKVGPMLPASRMGGLA